MMCLECGAEMETHRENYRYTISGLTNIVLKNIEVSQCHECGETEVAIPHIETLHRAIALTLIRKRTRLGSEEIRYLRKSLGWSGTDFAKRMGVTSETVSRWENGHIPMGSLADRLLRTLVMLTEKPERNYATEFLTAITEESEEKATSLNMYMEDEEWCTAFVGA